MRIPKSIFLIEDNMHDQFFFLQALREIDSVFLLDVANNGREAIEKLENAIILPDMIFTDIHMPEMDGITCLIEILKNPQTKNIPVVVLSSDTSEIDRIKDIGARAFIKKPDDCERLKERLAHVIRLDFINDRHLADDTFQTALAAY